MSKQPKTVFVGLSGGVDSSVAALRLRREGYDVVGVFIKVWHPDFLECDWETERLDAMRVAATLDIPFLTCDAESVYQHDVAQYFITEYQAGRTPNPDVMCNQHVKFGAFLEFARERGADHIATGHYARRAEDTDGGVSLYRGQDTEKDQSYFLWTLTQEQLRSVLLPIGTSSKSEVRVEAEAAGLMTAEKKDSQGICFLGHIDIPEFLSHYIDLTPGDVLDTSGNVVGTHRGAVVYTVGQRHGFHMHTSSAAQTPHYVVDRDVAANTITVAANKPQQARATQITLRDCNYINFQPAVGDELSVQTRYRQPPIACVIAAREADRLTIEFMEPTERVSVGQSCVLYNGEQCLGGGIIDQCHQ